MENPVNSSLQIDDFLYNPYTMNKNKVFILSWPAGAGKNTIWNLVKPLCESYIEESVSATSRPARSTEQNGREYYFVSREQFEAKIANHEFLEYALVHTNYYGSPKSELERIIRAWKNPLYIIDVQWALLLRPLLEEEWYEVITIFLLPPSIEVMKERIRWRGTESEEQFEIRLQSAMREFEQQNLYDTQIVNDDIEKAKNELITILWIEYAI